MEFKPLYDNILVKLDVSEKKSHGGIILVDNERKDTREGNVMAIGSGRLNADGSLSKLSLKVNDNIIFGQHSGIKITLDNNDYLILREAEIFGVIK